MSNTNNSTKAARRPFDIIIYGATGFAGKHVVKHFVHNHPEVRIAIAGRNRAKLNQLATDLNNNTASSDTNDTNDIKNHINTINPDQILVAPADDEHKQELIHILSQAKICLACAGPYRQNVGRNVLEAAIESQTDYLDLCGEPQFYDDMLSSFDALARERKTLVLSACAFDCVPSEFCFALASRELVKKYGSISANANASSTDVPVQVTNVEIVHTFQGIKCANATTFHAAVDGFHASYTGELKASRQKVKDCFPQLQNDTSSKRPKEWKRMVATPSMTSPVYHEDTDSYLLKFMGADAACILASDRYLRLRSIDDNTATNTNTSPDQKSSSSSSSLPPMPFLSLCFGLQSKSHAYTFLGFGAIFATLAKFSWGCNILHSSPETFTRGFFREGGPTDEELVGASFATYGTAYGTTGDQVVKVKFSGGEPGYIATAAMMSALALTVLNHRESIKFEGGVMLPGAAFNGCDVVYDVLRQEGLQIEVIDSANDENV
mmetsp:Transcript_6566/g.9967  ORF Transcript_6566/g.9967 Transcript_6566/m.9967 type:complete len:494 (+) Transcript_6566:30-1511(+)